MTDDHKRNHSHSHSPLNHETGKKIVYQVRARCLKRSRKYTLKDLNELRHLETYRAMPTNILCATDIIAAGLGLSTVSKNSLSGTKEVRSKQIQIAKKLQGYRNYISLVPKKERICNIHPSTPTKSEILRLSKRNFDKRVKNWKRDIHRWDAINSVAEIPYNLLTDRMLHERAMSSTQYYRNSSLYSWSPKKIQSPASSIIITNKSEKENKDKDKEESQLIKQLIFDDDQNENQNDHDDQKEIIYSSTKKKWYKPRNGANNGIKVKISKAEAIECLKICISNIRSKQNEMDRNVGYGERDNGDMDNFDELIVKEFGEVLNKMKT